MAPIKLVCTINNVTFAPAEDNGEIAEIAIKTSVFGPVDRELLSGLPAHNVRWVMYLRPRGEQEDKPIAGTVAGFDRDRMTFIMPHTISRRGLAKGTFVITADDIVCVILSAKAEAGDLFRRMVMTGSATPERIQAELPGIEYTCAQVGGLITTPKGQVPYYSVPGWSPEIGGNVHTMPPKQFFQWNDETQTALLHRFATVMEQRDVDPGVSAMMIRNAARAAGIDDVEYKEAVLGVIDSTERYNEIEKACTTLFKEVLYDDV